MKVLHVFTLFSTARSFFDGQFAYLSEHGYNLHLICSPAERMDDYVNRNHLVYCPVEISRRISPLADIRAIWAITRYIRRQRIDAVVGHTPKGALVAMVASVLMRVPRRIYYRHGLIYTTAGGIKRFILKKEEQFVGLLSTRIVNVSPSIGELAVRDRLNSSRKQQVIGEGTCGGIDARHKFNADMLDPARLQAYRRKLNLSSDDFVIGFCGRLCKDKGIAELVGGFRRFRTIHPQLSAKLLLVGDFDERDILPSALKKKISTCKDIIYTGYIDRDVEYYYSLMDLFVFPSYREGFGMSVLEASAMGKPVLVSRSHGCIDSIREGETGFYIEPDPDSIRIGIELFKAPETRLRIGMQGREFVLQNFDHRVMWPKVLEFYHSL